MSLFGIDLGSPADRQKLTLTRELELRRSKWDRPGYLYQGGADLCLRHGKFRPGRELPERYEHLWRLDGNTCYFEALRAAEADPTLRYCEGYTSVGSGMFVSHAWCIAPDDGVLELRYPKGGGWRPESRPNMVVLPCEHWGYWGVTFRTELVLAHSIAPLHLGMLDRSRAEEQDMVPRFGEKATLSEHDHPILKLPYDPERTSL